MKNINNTTFFTISIICLLILRLFLNAFIPLMDATEARYAEIARIMAETNNWITPQIDYGVPFWAKPPLSTWLSAISIKIFGVNEFAVRLPYFLVSLTTVLLVVKFIKQTKYTLVLLCFILLTLPEFLLHAGVVSTDTVLNLCITLFFLAFWKSINSQKKSYWNYLVFVSIGLGLLAKGPIMLILTMPPVVFWLLYSKEYKTVFKKFPWILGTIITLSIAAPWYYLSELQTKGFLDYFIVGEHFRRFFDSSWHGDKYGFPKTQPFAIIWVFLFATALPWIQTVVFQIFKQRREIIKDKWVVFLISWLLWTPIFFTISSSLIHTYTLPVMVPIALLAVHFWDNIKRPKTVILTSLLFPFLIVVVLGLSLVDNNLEQYSKTDKYLLEGQIENTDSNLFYLGKKSYSSQFYSEGMIKSISSEELQKKVDQGESFKIIISNKTMEELEIKGFDKFKILSFNKKRKLYAYMPSIE